MADELLIYYEKELAYIRQMGAAFAKEHPKVAGRLGIGTDIVEDPHVSRLIESFSYLNARIQHKLDDDFPELSDAILSVVFPHYQRPLPSMSIVQFTPDRDQLEAPYSIPRHTLLETEHFQGENCQFNTVYDVELLPAEIIEASLIGAPFSTPGASRVRGASSVLQLKLSTFNSQIPFIESGIKKLRVFLKGQTQYIHPLYQLLMSQCLNVVATHDENNAQPVFLGHQAIKEVGFGSEEGMLPYPAASFMGYRMLTEFFAYPEKFMFFDIEGFAEKLLPSNSNELNLYIYLESSDVELEHNISAKNFVLGCTPVINLFEKDADPIKLNHNQLEHHVQADVRRPIGFEIYSIDKVSSISPEGDCTDFLPLYGLNHSHNGDDSEQAFWLASRRHAKLSNYERDEGTDVFVSLVDLGFNPNTPSDKTLLIKAHCSNRDLPEKLPFNLDHPKLQCVEGAPPCEKIRCLTQPTRTIRPPLRDHARWRLISHLNLNHLSLTGRNNAAEALKEILRLYDFRESSVSRALINSIMSVDARAVSAPVPVEGRPTMCKGMEIEITLDSSQLTGSSAYLFASILDHFFSLYCSINSFSRVLVKQEGREGYLKKCPIRAGEKILL